MAISFEVETGSGSSTATSYASIAELEGYMDSFGYARTTETDDTLKVKLNKATKALDGMYALRFPGGRTNDDQALEWPREYATYLDGTDLDDDEIPPEIVRATCALAANISAGVDPFAVVTDPSVRSESVTVGPISASKEYLPGRGSARPDMPLVADELIRLVTSSGRVMVTRA